MRIGDVVILPVTGFSPGVGLFGAKTPWGEFSPLASITFCEIVSLADCHPDSVIADEQAMVEHLFAGSWKNS